VATAAAGGLAMLLLIMDDDDIMVPFCCMAICANIAWDFCMVGLIEKVMPEPQWPTGIFCLQ
jgi:hypothetical protein